MNKKQVKELVEIPDFLIEMSNQINTQSNRMTADPLFEVRYKTSLITEEGYNESHFEIVDCEDGITLYHSKSSDNYNALAEHLLESHEKWCMEWCDEEAGIEFSGNSFIADFNDNYDCHGWMDLPEGIKKLHMQEIEVTVNSHFTEAAAQAFIDRKQHDYPKLYIYAISMCFCYPMIELRNWIKSLTANQLKGINNETT
ncbi:hypothetical protein [Vibrio litoralis]|uniref:hypothetical protein n=1 Tax=Vibrio litoralis TaxID=335972 RepID=UPI000402177A|nr:hypothetical protein [Vibrio litoralis]